jgi:hypothetical protein
MTVTTAVRVGDIFGYGHTDTYDVLVSEVIRIEDDGETVVTAETLSYDERRTVAYMDASVFEDLVYLGSVRPSSDRVNHVEDGDLFVYTYMDPHSADIAGNTFVLEITHAYVPGDLQGVRGNVHMTDGFFECDALPPLRFERAHLRDFQYCGKIDNGTRDGRVKASEKPTTGDTVVTSEATGPTTGTDASA